ncbi:MAG TPA: 6-phosphofructokinase [Clostridia bacterium]|nr:6-phosphofructokinase [Clostridia bacterium]
MKTIGVLTSGGDAPGMNAALRAVVRAGIAYNMTTYGINRGYEGLINGEFEKLTARSVSGILQRGGTIIRTARSERFKEKIFRERALEMCKVFGIEALVVIGGDGSYRGALDFTHEGMKCVVIPATIDNDVSSTEYCIGYDTALNTALSAIDKLRDTAYSHERVAVIEVMGRHAGYIAINDGIAGGADAIVIPEHKYNFQTDIIKPIMEGRNRGKRDHCIVIAEGVGDTAKICKDIEETTGIRTVCTILGYIQRGGSPSARDRVMASMMGFKAIEILNEERFNKAICLIDNKIVDIDIEEALKMEKASFEYDVNVAKILAM